MEKDEIEYLYALYGNQIFLYALTLCKNWHGAEDLTSDTFYKALLALDGSVTNVKHWLLRVCRNLFIDDYRKKKREVLKQIEDIHLPIEQIEPVEMILKDASHQYLYSAIMQLSQTDREILAMFYFLDCSISQIAVHIGRTQGATKTGLSRARKRLKEILEEEKYE